MRVLPRPNPIAPLLGATTLTFIKPRMKSALRHLVPCLFAAGVTANEVTTASIVGSIAIGALLAINHDTPAVFLLLPAWQVVRTALASIDGTLAVDFGQKSKLGGVLNEAGDIVSEIAMWLPLVFVVPSHSPMIALIILLSIACELAGGVGAMLGGARRIEGPLGKADRSILLGAIGLWIGLGGTVSDAALTFGGVFVIAMLVLTIVNRLRFARGPHRARPIAEVGL